MEISIAVIERLVDEMGDDRHKKHMAKIRAALAEALKPSHNSSNMPCSCTMLYVCDPDGVALLRVNPSCKQHGMR